MATNNIKLLNQLVKENALSSEFLSRIPSITQENLAKIGTTLENYPVLANEFIGVLTNQVIRTMFMTRELDNPLAMFERGELDKFGKSLEMIYVDVVTGKDFNDRFGGSYEAECLAPEKVNNVKVQYLTENSRLKYKVTISSDMIASAFKDEFGLSSMVNQLVSRMSTSYKVDKMLMTWKLMDYMNTKKVQGVKPIDNATAKQFTIQVKKIIKDMNFPSRDYNNSGVMTQSKPADLYIVVDNNTSAILDVELLATAFNMSKADIEGRIVEIPYFGDENRVALIMDRDKLQIFQTKFASGTESNSGALFTNSFLHRWDLLGACDFANCVEITTSQISKMRESMPYDVVKFGTKDDEGTVIADLKATEIEIDTNGDVKSKAETILKEEDIKKKKK